MTKITKADCQKLINEMIRDGKKRSTMSNLKSCLNIVFECALDDDIVAKNPAKNLQIPQTESKERKAIDQHQIDLFMRYVKESRRYSYSYPAFVALFNLGVRIGEMAALTWEDIDFKENMVRIDKTVDRYRKAEYGFTMGIASPKSKTSIRSISINSVVKSTLLRLKMQNIASSACLPYVDDAGHVRGAVSGFVFLNSFGNVWNEPSFRELIKRIVDDFNQKAVSDGTEQIEVFCPHMTRHTYTSLAYSAGADVKIVSQILSVTNEKKRDDAGQHKMKAG